MPYYNVTIKPTRRLQMTARYKSKILNKGKTYTARRKLTASDVRLLKSKKHQRVLGYKTLSVKKIIK